MKYKNETNQTKNLHEADAYKTNNVTHITLKNSKDNKIINQKLNELMSEIEIIIMNDKEYEYNYDVILTNISIKKNGEKDIDSEKKNEKKDMFKDLKVKKEENKTKKKNL